MKMLKQYWEVCVGIRRKAAMAVALAGLAGVLEGSALLMLIPVLSNNMGLFQQGDGNWLVAIAHRLGMSEDHILPLALCIFALLGIGAATARYATESLLLKTRTRIEESSRQLMTTALLRMEWTHFISLKMGDISKSLIIEGLQMGEGAQVFLLGLGAVLAVVVYLGAALVVSPEMTFYTLLFGALGGGIYQWCTRKARVHADELSRVVGTIGERTGDIFGNLKFFRAAGRSETADINARLIYREHADTYFRSQIWGSIMRMVFDSGAIIFISIFLITALYVKNASIASTLVFLAIFYRLAPKLLVVQQSLFQARTYLVWYETWKDRLDFARFHEVSRSGGRTPSFDQSLRFQEVSFTYPNTPKPVLQEVSLELRQGQCIAIVGSSGSGKSTLVDLVTGLLRPQSGQILLDSQLLSDIDMEQWRNCIGLVMQESPLFHISVAENIAWGDLKPDRDRILSCARMAYAWEFIERLPQGLDTIIGEKGARLSGGQRQRLAVARALYSSPRLLILDEATSALDGEAESILQKALEEIKGTCAILMVAHRLKTVTMADKIVVLEQGRIVEQGNWQELINNKGGIFHRMASLQGLIER